MNEQYVTTTEVPLSKALNPANIRSGLLDCEHTSLWLNTGSIKHPDELTLMLFVRWVVQPHGDEDEEDEERPDDLHQELKLRDRKTPRVSEGQRQETINYTLTHRLRGLKASLSVSVRGRKQLHVFIIRSHS